MCFIRLSYTTAMRFRDGRRRYKLLFCALLAFYGLTFIATLANEASHFGETLTGVSWRQGYAWPTTKAAHEAGLRFGTTVLQVNGTPVGHEGTFSGADPWHRQEDNLNRLRVLLRNGEEALLEIRVVRNTAVTTWQYLRMPVVLGFIFVAVGVVSFLLRPWERQSAAVVSTTVLIGCWLTINWTERFVPRIELAEILSYTLNGVVAVVPFHMGLAFPLAHKLYLRRPSILAALYTIPGVAFLAMHLSLREINTAAGWRIGEITIASCALVGMLFFMGRTAYAALRPPDRLTRQRARVILLGTLIGFGPILSTSVAQLPFEWLVVDSRVFLLPMVAFPLALVYTVFRHDVFTTRSVVQRSAVYSVASAIALIAAFFLITMVNGVLDRQLVGNFAPIVSGLILAAFLLPMLHAAPSVDRWFTDRLYPKRKQLPVLLREIAEEFAAATTIENIMDILARAPHRTCDATSGGVLFFARDDNQPALFHSTREDLAVDPGWVSDKPLFQFLKTTKRRIRRFTVSTAPHFQEIREESLALLDRVDAQAILPIIRQDEVVGGLIMGPRERGDAYNVEEFETLRTLAQQAVLALVRNEALDQVREHDQEVADLKRVLPSHVVDTVIERGGVSTFKTRRKPVTVFFSDLRGFTGFSDSVEPEEVMHTLAQFHRAMGKRITEFGGTLEHFAGDGFMVFFNDPEEDPDHIMQAVRMAAAMREDVFALRAEWTRKGYGLDVGMGIHTGYATCGFVGYEGRRDYAVIGNVTNLAARLCDHAQGGEILVTQRVVTELGEEFDAEPVGEISLKGFHLPQLTYRILEAAHV